MTGSDGYLESGSRLLANEYLLELFTRAFEGAGGSTREYPVGTSRDICDGGKRAVRTEFEDNSGNVGRHEGDST